jgi:predicted MFS family arabinose efflux permease
MTVTGSLVPARLRARYTARRLRLLQVATLAALLFHGVAADGIARAFEAIPALGRWGFDPLLTGFSVMFALAAACRFISSWHLFRYSTPKDDPSTQSHVHASDFLARFKQGNDGRFLIYAIAGNAALQIAQPFFNPWMLRQGSMHGPVFDWIVAHLGPQAPYSVLLAATYIGRILMLDLSGTIAQKHGGLRLLWLGGMALPIMAVFWLFSRDFTFLLIGQIATGAALSAWELGVFLMNFEAIKPNERTAMLTYFTLANESGKTGGSLVGGAMLDSMGKDTGAYAAVFWTSCLARAAVLALLVRLRSTQPHERH